MRRRKFDFRLNGQKTGKIMTPIPAGFDCCFIDYHCPICKGHGGGKVSSFSESAMRARCEAKIANP